MKYKVKVGVEFDGIESPGGNPTQSQVLQVKVPVQLHCPRGPAQACQSADTQGPADKGSPVRPWWVHAIMGISVVVVVTLISTVVFGAVTGDFTLFRQVVDPVIEVENAVVKLVNHHVDQAAK